MESLPFGSQLLSSAARLYPTAAAISPPTGLSPLPHTFPAGSDASSVVSPRQTPCLHLALRICHLASGSTIPSAFPALPLPIFGSKGEWHLEVELIIELVEALMPVE